MFRGMGVAKVHVRCRVTVRASVGMLGLRMCGGEWGWGWGWCARSSASATVPRACTIILCEAYACMVEAGVGLG